MVDWKKILKPSPKSEFDRYQEYAKTTSQKNHWCGYKAEMVSVNDCMRCDIERECWGPLEDFRHGRV
jgi:hypothetical protein